jgi:hypothetical protein
LHAEQQKADGREGQDRAMLKREVRGARVYCEEAHHTTRKHQQARFSVLSVRWRCCARDESESHALFRVNWQEMEGDSMQEEIGSEAHGEMGGDGF